MLSKIFFDHFKSCRKGELPLAALTMLIGANASGKSNAIEGLRLLSWLAQGQKLSSIQYQVQDSDRIVRGRVNELGYCGRQSFILGCETSEKDWNTLTVQLSVRNEEELHIETESITGPAAPPPLYEVAQASSDQNTDLRVAYNNFARGGRKPQLTCSDQLAIFTQLESAARFADGNAKAKKVIPQVTRNLQQWLADILFLPMAAIIETGRHIAHLADGRQRYRYAQDFVVQIKQALDGDAPWQPTNFPKKETILWAWS